MHHFNIQNAPTASRLVILKKSFVSFICESLIHVIVISNSSFYVNGFTLSLALKQRLGATRKCLHINWLSGTKGLVGAHLLDVG